MSVRRGVIDGRGVLDYAVRALPGLRFAYAIEELSDVCGGCDGWWGWGDGWCGRC
jgi:hypothetical protein